MSQSVQPDQSMIRQWIMEKLHPTAAEEKLKAHGFDPAHIAEYITAFKKALSARRQFRGFILTGVGAFLGFVGCLFTVTNPIPEMYDFFLYGVVSAAMLFIFWGLYLIFE